MTAAVSELQKTAASDPEEVMHKERRVAGVPWGLSYSGRTRTRTKSEEEAGAGLLL